ncbi:hypothetical protein TEA_014460 [Camellia sinensis var. sinensis]|uniref:Uncharacterized protein n=1 Tax=Camellia sinensis var. sinensis TaxID=542762 RepID=A0A4V3WPJ1_CAMSN|nr:hypothetical protein TEA_014460 [Camellia sinensis var. sinensis]
MITRSNLAEQLREYQIRSKHDWASVSFFASTSNLTFSRFQIKVNEQSFILGTCTGNAACVGLHGSRNAEFFQYQWGKHSYNDIRYMGVRSLLKIGSMQIWLVDGLESSHPCFCAITPSSRLQFYHGEGHDVRFMYISSLG